MELLLDLKANEVKVLEGVQNLDGYYRNLDCDCIDIVTRKIGRKYFDIVCDDEGLLKANPKISAIDNYGEPMLVGSLIFTKHNTQGEAIGLTQSEVDYIKDRIMTMYTRKHMNGYLMLTQCEY